MLLIHCLQDFFGRISPWWCSGGLLMVCTSFMPFVYIFVYIFYTLLPCVCNALMWKFAQPSFTNLDSLSQKLRLPKQILQNILPFVRVTHGKNFFQPWRNFRWRFVSSYLRLTSALLLSRLSVSIEVGLSSSLTCMNCGVSAIEDDGLSATNVGDLSSSLSCISCSCSVSTIEVGGLSSSSTCIGIRFSRASCRLVSYQIS